MDIRTARLTAWTLVATVAVVGSVAILLFGAHAPFPRKFSGASVAIWWPTWKMALGSVGQAGLLAGIHEVILTRSKRFRRNIIRAGGFFGVNWIAGPVLILTILGGGFAIKLGRTPDMTSMMAVVVGILMILKSNMLPKSRPGWFNGLVFPALAARPDIWRRVHRASAWRGMAIGLLCIALPWTDLDRMLLRQILLAALIGDLAIGCAHALLLNLTTEGEKTHVRNRH